MIEYKGKKLIYAQSEQGLEMSKDIQMLLFGKISDGSFDEETGRNTIDSHAFAAEMLFLHENGFNITVRINSEGGSVLHGFAILDAIRVTNADTFVVGMAASMAGVLLQFGKRRIMNDFASIMVHAPSGGDDQLLEIVAAQLKNILSARSKLSIEELDKIFKEGKDIWFAVTSDIPDERNAELKGLVDEVIKTETSATFARPNLESNYDGAKLYAIYNKILTEEVETETQNQDQMPEFVNAKAKLGLGAEATETQVLEKINALVEKANEKPENNDEEVKNLKAQIATLTAEKTASLIKDAKDAGYPEDSIKHLEEFAGTNFEGARNMVEAFKTANTGNEGGKPAPVSASVPSPSAGSGAGKPEGEKKLKTYDEYMETEEGEKEFYALDEADQIKVLDAKSNKKPASVE